MATPLFSAIKPRTWTPDASSPLQPTSIPLLLHLTWSELHLLGLLPEPVWLQEHAVTLPSMQDTGYRIPDTVVLVSDSLDLNCLRQQTGEVVCQLRLNGFASSLVM